MTCEHKKEDSTKSLLGLLGGGFKYFLFHPYLGNDPIWLDYQIVSFFCQVSPSPLRECSRLFSQNPGEEGLLITEIPGSNHGLEANGSRHEKTPKRPPKRLKAVQHAVNVQTANTAPVNLDQSLVKRWKKATVSGRKPKGLGKPFGESDGWRRFVPKLEWPFWWGNIVQLKICMSCSAKKNNSQYFAFLIHFDWFWSCRNCLYHSKWLCLTCFDNGLGKNTWRKWWALDIKISFSSWFQGGFVCCAKLRPEHTTPTEETLGWWPSVWSLGHKVQECLHSSMNGNWGFLFVFTCSNQTHWGTLPIQQMLVLLNPGFFKTTPLNPKGWGGLGSP